MDDFQNKFIEIIKTRRTVRLFKKDVSIPKEDLMLLAEAAEHAPSGQGQQFLEILFVTEKEKIKAIHDAIKDVWETMKPQLAPILNTWISIEIFQKRLNETKNVGINWCASCPVQCEKSKGELNFDVYACRTRLAYRSATALMVLLINNSHKKQWKKAGKQNSIDKSLIDLWTNTWTKIENASINNAVENVLLAAKVLGIGSCYTHSCNIAENKIKKILNIPRNTSMHGIICLGIPDEEPMIKPRRPLENFVHFNEY
ncbi:MAG: nitroreductase family protein [Candidatus Helarchaeota archaeon]